MAKMLAGAGEHGPMLVYVDVGSGAVSSRRASAGVGLNNEHRTTVSPGTKLVSTGGVRNSGTAPPPQRSAYHSGAASALTASSSHSALMGARAMGSWGAKYSVLTSTSIASWSCWTSTGCLAAWSSTTAAE